MAPPRTESRRTRAGSPRQERNAATTTDDTEATNLANNPPGPSFEIQAAHSAAVNVTEKHAQSIQTVHSHNRRLMKMIGWIRVNYLQYYTLMVVKLTPQEMADKDRFHKSTHDFDYQKIRSDIIKAFLSATKIKATKPDGTEIFYSFDNLRKYKDAILFGAKRKKIKLPDQFLVDMNAYVDSLKKENQSAKKTGQVTEHESDPISFGLYRQICINALNSGFIFLWAFTVMQWNCMARSINIDNLRFNCFAIGTDSLVVKYWDTKKDKKGEKTSPKNCYANPFDFTICFVTALGIYLCLNDEEFSSGKKHTLFISEGSKEGTASHRYCIQLIAMFKTMFETLTEYIRPGHANAHGTRKGAAVAATSGTTCPHPLLLWRVVESGVWGRFLIFTGYLQKQEISIAAVF